MLAHASGEVALANKSAQAWLAQPGCLLMQGRTGAQKPAMKRVLDQACGVTGPARTAGLHVPAAAGQTATYVIAIPLRQQTAAGMDHRSHRAMAMLVVQGRQWEPPEMQTLLNEIFGLTQAEIRLMQYLLNDMTPTEAAERLCVALETVRSQLKSIFQKTGTRRQSELLRLMTKVLGVT
jgi:DNA-binding CsgD family transcriptional regulator